MKELLSVILFLTAFFVFTIFSNTTVHAQESSTNLPVPAFAQQRNLSCESSAARMVLFYYGHNVDEVNLQSALPLNANPYIGFRGNVDGRIGFDNYGVYAGPIADLMDQNGLPSTAYFAIDEDFIRQKLTEGKPVIIWGTARLKGRGKTVLEEAEGQTYKLVLGEHTFVVRGWDNGKFVINDSIGGRVYSVKSLASLGWNSLDRMAVIPD